MDETKQPGIRFHGVELRSLRFDIKDRVPAQIPLAPSVLLQGRLSKDERRLLFSFTFDLFGGVEAEKKPPVDLVITFVGKFSCASESNMSLREFANSHAPGLMFPYLRELVSNLTARSSLPTLNLSPVNVLTWARERQVIIEIESAPKAQQDS